MDIAATAPATTTYFTILYIAGYDTEVTFKGSTLIARDGSAIWVNNEDANVTVINSLLNMITTYMNRLYQAVMVQRVNYLNITNNMAFGLGAGYSLGFVVIDYDMNGSMVDDKVKGVVFGTNGTYA